MKRLLAAAVVFTLGLGASSDALARGRRVVVHRAPRHRTTIVVHRGFPLRRAFPAVVVIPPRRTVRVVPVRFLPAVVWAPVVIARPGKDVIAWEDGEAIAKEDDWTDVTLNSDSRGRRLFLDITGPTQMQFAEVVFENGDTQVVDFAEKTHPAGVYSLLDFKDGRKVDHVRIVARATTDESRLGLLMEK